MFMDLTHYYSGETVSVRASTIDSVRTYKDRSLVINDKGKGTYYAEPRTMIVDLVTAIESSCVVSLDDAND